MKSYDVAIIGAGTAGLSARSEVARLTKNYVVIDPGPLGTTCARVGCMPSKALIQAANDLHVKERMSERGIEGSEALRANVPEVLRYVRKMRDDFVSSVVSDINEWKSEHLIAKKARFLSPTRLDLGGEEIEAKSIVIATGSKVLIPDAWKKYSKYFITTDQLFDLEDLPKRLAVIGLGVIGIEVGQALRRLGIEVYGFSRGKAIGGLSDPDLQDLAAEIFSHEMPLSYGGAEILGEQNNELVIKSNGREYSFEKLVVAVGRVPNVKDLGLDQLGITCDKRGVPHYDPKTFRIGEHNIFIAGDAMGERLVLHEAADEGRICGYNAARESVQCFERRCPISITFSSPEIAIVGQSYKEIQSSGKAFVQGEVNFSNQGRSRILGENKGMLRIYGEAESGKILGAEMLAPRGEHLAHLLSWSISMGLDVHQMLSLPFYHPVVEEGMRKALRQLARATGKPREGLEVMRCQEVPVEHL